LAAWPSTVERNDERIGHPTGARLASKQSRDGNWDSSETEVTCYGIRIALSSSKLAFKGEVEMEVAVLIVTLLVLGSQIPANDHIAFRR